MINQIKTGAERGAILLEKIRVSLSLYETTYSKSEDEKIRSSRKLLRLSEREYDYLELSSGIESKEIPSDWGYKPHELESQIVGKRNLLPVRFRILADDIELLERGEYFDIEKWKKSIDDIAFIGDNRDPPSYSAGSYEERPWRSTGMGSFFGRITSQMIVYPRTENIAERQADMIWGFANSLCFSDAIDTTGKQREEHIKNILEKVVDRCENSYREYEDVQEDAADWYQENQHQRSILQGEISNILNHYEIDLPDAMIMILSREIIPDNERISNKGSEKLIEEYIHPKTVIETVIDKELVEKRQLEEILREDTRRLQQKSSRGIDTIELIKYLLIYQPSSSSDIARHFMHKPDSPNRDWTAGITETARDLANKRNPEKHSERDIWTERPVLKGDKEAWGLTIYGKVLSEFSQDDFQGLYSVEEEDLQKAYIELDIPRGVYVPSVQTE